MIRLDCSRHHDISTGMHTLMPCLCRRYVHQGLTISHGEAARLRADGLARVLAAKRLLLVLDLDHTLLNSTRLSEARNCVSDPATREHRVLCLPSRPHPCSRVCQSC